MRGFGSSILIMFLVTLLVIGGFGALLVHSAYQREEVRQAQFALQAAQRDLAALRGEIAWLQNELAAAHMDNDALNAEIAELKRLLAEREAQLSQSRADVQQLAQQAAAAAQTAAQAAACPAPPAGPTDLDRALIALSIGALVLGVGLVALLLTMPRPRRR